MYDTLVLDMAQNPISTCSWKRAMKMLYEERASVLVEDEKRRLHSACFDVGMPRVIVAKNYVVKRMRKSIPCSRRNVYVRDNGECQYCGIRLGTDEYTLDHVIPRSQGGTTTWTNTVLACVDCNHEKDGRTPAQAHMHLRHVPVEPKPNESRFFKLRIKFIRPEWLPWQNWLYAEEASWAYWNVELDK